MNFHIKRTFNYLEYRVIRPHRKGHGIHSPFLFDFVTQVLCTNHRKDRPLQMIKSIHRDLLRDKTYITIDDKGAGSSIIKGDRRRISDIARYSSTSYKYGHLLYNIVNHYKPRTIIELGTCLGIGSMYLASGHEQSEVHTIEGSKALWEMAQTNFNKSGFSDICGLSGTFDDVLPSLIKEKSTFDLVFIDGNHSKEATLRYFQLLLPHVKNHTILIFDDIRWSTGMEKAWEEICSHKKVKLSVDLFNLGIVFFNENIIKQHFTIYY